MQSFRVSDMHNDILTEVDSRSSAAMYFESSMENCQRAEICLAIWGTEYAAFPEQAVENFAVLKRQLPQRIAVHLCFEDLWYADERTLERIAELRPFYCSLTWNHANALAGGALSDGRLTPFGAEAIRFLQKNGILVDTAHLNRASFYDVLNVTEAPLINSHTCCSGLLEHARNCTDDQISQIEATGGLVGLTMVGDFLTPDGKAELDDYVRQIDYCLSCFGSGAIAVGTDFFGTKNLPRTVKNYETYPVLLEKLLQMGYNETVIQNVLYENLHRFTERRKSHE